MSKGVEMHHKRISHCYISNTGLDWSKIKRDHDIMAFCITQINRVHQSAHDDRLCDALLSTDS